MSDIQVFDFEDNAVRVTDIDGEPWFVAADVCRVLGYDHTPSALRSLDEDERGVQIMHTPSGDQEMNVINESGLYHLVLVSRKPEAKKFRKWVTAEVLPSIRKTGAYIAPETDCRTPGGVRNFDSGLEDGTLTQWVGIVREARLLFGKAAARAVWAQTPLPKIDIAETIAAFDASAAENAVREILSTPFKGGTIGDFVRDRAEFGEMQASGVRPFFLDGKKYYAVGNGFFGDKTRAVLLSMPQARRYPVSVRFGAVAVRAVLIPADFVERVADGE